MGKINYLDLPEGVRNELGKYFNDLSLRTEVTRKHLPSNLETEDGEKIEKGREFFKISIYGPRPEETKKFSEDYPFTRPQKKTDVFVIKHRCSLGGNRKSDITPELYLEIIPSENTG